MKQRFKKMFSTSGTESKSLPPARQLLALRTAHLDIFAAARAGELERIREFIIDNEVNPGSHDLNALDYYDPDDESYNGESALTYAIENGHTKIVKMLIDAKANFYPEYGYYLIKAIKKGHVPIVKVLLEAKANPNVRREKYAFIDEFPLFVAIKNDNLDIVRMLIAAKASVDTSTKFSLNLAAGLGNLPIVHELIDAKATLQNQDGALALHCAAEKGHLEVVRELLNARAIIDHKNFYEKKTALHLAAEGGYADVVRELIRCRANVNARKDSLSESILWGAVKADSKECIKILLDNKADLDQNIFSKTFSLARNEGFLKHLNALNFFLFNFKTTSKTENLKFYIWCLQLIIKQHEEYCYLFPVASKKHKVPIYLQAARDTLEIFKSCQARNSRLAVLAAFHDRAGKRSPLNPSAYQQKTLFDPNVLRLCFNLASVAKKPDNKNTRQTTHSIDEAIISSALPGSVR